MGDSLLDLAAEPWFGQGTLLAVHAHPDDESLWTGGLLAQWAASGGRTVVVTASRGERGEMIGDDLADLEGDFEAVARYRSGELRRALLALGVSGHWFLDEASPTAGPWRDSGMKWDTGEPTLATASDTLDEHALSSAPQPDLVAALRTIVETERPRVVVTYGPRGGYGHPDHVLVHRLTNAAIEGSGAAVLWRRIDEADVADQVHAVQRWVHEASRHDPSLLAGGPGHRRAILGPIAAFPTDSFEAPRLAQVHVAPVAAEVLSALRAHRSQVQYVRRTPAADESLVGTYALSDGYVRAIPARERYGLMRQTSDVDASTSAAITAPDGTVA